MPRTTKSPSQPRTAQHPFQIRISAEERENWDRAAQGVPTSTWARDTLNRVAALQQKGASSPIQRASLPSITQRWDQAAALVKKWRSQAGKRDDVALLVVPIVGDGAYFTVNAVQVQADAIKIGYQPETAVGAGSEDRYLLVITADALTGVSDHLITFETDGDLGALVFGPAEMTKVNAYNLAH